MPQGAPRHTSRVSAVQDLVTQHGLPCSTWSWAQAQQSPSGVLPTARAVPCSRE